MARPRGEFAVVLNDKQRARLAGQIEVGPIPAAHGVCAGGLPIWPSEYGMSSAARLNKSTSFEMASLASGNERASEAVLG